MRYGIIPTRAAEWLALQLGHVPNPVLDALLAPMQTRTLLTAQRSGLLARLSERADVRTLARELTLNEECLGLVLRVLQAMGYASRRRDKWGLSTMGRRYFGPHAKQPYSAFLEHAASQWTMMERLDEVLQSGRGIDFHENQTPAEWDAYQRAMLENAQGFAWFVADHMPVKEGASECVDVAGSHGFVGAALCRKHRGLRSLVLDRAEALPHAKKLALEYGYDDLVRFEQGDVREIALQEPVDVMLLCNILHHFTEAENREILARARRGLKPGGSIGIFEIETPLADAAPDAAGDGLALYFRISSTSTCFRGQDYADWLAGAGFLNVRVVRSVRMPSRMLVTAINFLMRMSTGRGLTRREDMNLKLYQHPLCSTGAVLLRLRRAAGRWLPEHQGVSRAVVRSRASARRRFAAVPAVLEMEHMKVEQTFWITGAASGLGQTLTTAALASGQLVCASDIDLGKLERTAARAGWPRERILLLGLDVRDPAAWRRAASAFQARFSRLDVLINNAGVLVLGLSHAASDNDVNLTIDVNVKGVMFGSRQGAELMLKYGAGHIVNICSLASLSPVPGLGIYSASKFAVRGFSLALAFELEPRGIAVTCVCPDGIATPMLRPHQHSPHAALIFSGSRILTPQEVCDTIMGRVLERRPLEILLPELRGLLAKIAVSPLSSRHTASS